MKSLYLKNPKSVCLNVSVTFKFFLVQAETHRRFELYFSKSLQLFSKIF